MQEMLKSAWRQDVDVDRELARRAAYAATEANGQTPCMACGHAAQLYVRVDAMRFSAALCDTCATERLQYATIARAVVQLDALSSVPLVTSIDGIDLAQYAKEVLDGVNHDRVVPAAPTVPQAKALVIAVLEDKLRRALTPSQRVAVERAAASEAHQRFQQRRADLLDAQRRLHQPLRRFA